MTVDLCKMFSVDVVVVVIVFVVASYFAAKELPHGDK